jgi:hypothetical protein
MHNRQKIRSGPKVIHRHRVGQHALRRVSELVFAHGSAQAVLGWIDIGGMQTPLLLELDRSRLRKPKGRLGLYYYDGVTTDPRFEDLPETAPTHSVHG